MTLLPGVISFPIPPYQNTPIQSQFYQPSRFVISAITLGPTTTITTSVNHNYVISQQIRLLIPAPFGASQLNEAQGYVISVPNPNQVVVSIDSSHNVNPFTSSTFKTSSPQILAIGDISFGQTNSNGINSNLLFIPGSFQNISPA